MRRYKNVVLIALSPLLAGCLEADQTSTGFKTPSATGALSGNGGSQVNSGNEFSGVTGNGFAYQAGAIDDAGFQAFAGIVPGASVAAPPDFGAATMTGTFEVAVVDAILKGSQNLSGQSFVDSGNLTLSVDFQNKTVSGGGTGVDGGLFNIFLNNNQLTVDGTFAGDQLSGTVSYDGVSGPLDGLVGSNEVIGAFHGNSDGQVHAGGFIAN